MCTDKVPWESHQSGSTIRTGEGWAELVRLCASYGFISPIPTPDKISEMWGPWSLERAEEGIMNELIYIHHHSWGKKQLRTHPRLRKAQCPGLYIEWHSFLLTRVQNRETKALVSSFLSSKATIKCTMRACSPEMKLIHCFLGFQWLFLPFFCRRRCNS